MATTPIFPARSNQKNRTSSHLQPQQPAPHRQTWQVKGKTLTSDQVEFVDLDTYLREELVSPLEELFLQMVRDNGQYGHPLGARGKIGQVLIGCLNDRVSQVFFHLLETNTEIYAVIANHKAIVVPSGTVIAVEINQQQEV